MSRASFPETGGGATSLPDDLRPFVDWFESQPSARERFRWVLRDSLDELLDGQRTGRWSYQHLSKTEKTHLGTVVEINLTKEFELPDGNLLDWRVAGTDLDCKFSKDYGGWEIPMEMYLCADHGDNSGEADHAALLVWMNDDQGQWAAGLMRATDAGLRWRQRDGLRVRAYNRDNKRRLSEIGLSDVHWLWNGGQADLPENVLLHLGDEIRTRVFEPSSGQLRVNELFRARQGQLISRATILTVAQQDDGMKRARDARLPQHLGGEGMLVLGHQDASPHIAQLLGLPVPEKGEFVACRIAPVSQDDVRPKIYADGKWWAIAHADEAVSAAPLLPSAKPASGWIAYLKACS